MYWFTGDLLAINVSNGASQISAVSGIVQGLTPQTLAAEFTGLKSAKSFVASVDGVPDASPATIDMTGMNIDKLVIGTRRGGTSLMDSNLYSMSSNQLGDVSFVGRLWTETSVNGNTYTTTATTENPSGITLTLEDNAEESAVCPYIGAWPNVFLVRDTPCVDNRLIIRDDIAQIRDGVFQRAVW